MQFATCPLNALSSTTWDGRETCVLPPLRIDANAELIDRIAGDDMVRGVTIAAGGFFGPQGRELRVPLADPHQNVKKSSNSNTTVIRLPISKWKVPHWPASVV